MSRVHNFSSGPASLPEEVLKKIKSQILEYEDKGMSVLEMSHTGEVFNEIKDEATKLLTSLLHLDLNYSILYIPGSGHMNFSMVPLNFTTKNKRCTIVDTDIWTRQVGVEAEKFTGVNYFISETNKSLPNLYDLKMDENTDYVYMCTNNTTTGTCYHNDKIPKMNAPLIADMTSNLLSENYDMNKFDLAFAATQKNLGASGLSIAIIKKELLKTKSIYTIPEVLCYNAYYNSASSFATPNTFSIYIVKEIAKWLKEKGGVEQIEKINYKKARLLYEAIDESKIFYNDIKDEFRSIANVVFKSKDENLDKLFISKAKEAGFHYLEGYNKTGMRAGLYNAITLDSTKELVKFMYKFEKEFS